MDQIAENEEKVFQNYFGLQPKTRMKIINKMESDDRCRFTRCSKICDKEAKSSSNYLYGLHIIFFSSSIVIQIIHRQHEREPRTLGYQMQFKKRSKRIFQKYRAQNFRDLWEVEFDESRDLFQISIEWFKNQLQMHQNKIKVLYLSQSSLGKRAYKWKRVDLGIRSLAQLEVLNVCCNIDVRQFLFKLRKPLKSLCLGRQKIEVLNGGQIYQVEQSLNWNDANLNYQQLQRISAKKVGLNIGCLTERDILRFLRSWQNGTIGKEIDSYRWDLYPSTTFKFEKLCKFLRLEDKENVVIEIKHFIEPGRSASLFLARTLLIFDTRSRPFEIIF